MHLSAVSAHISFCLMCVESFRTELMLKHSATHNKQNDVAFFTFIQSTLSLSRVELSRVESCLYFPCTISNRCTLHILHINTIAMQCHTHQDIRSFAPLNMYSHKFFCSMCKRTVCMYCALSKMPVVCIINELQYYIHIRRQWKYAKIFDTTNEQVL